MMSTKAGKCVSVAILGLTGLSALTGCEADEVRAVVAGVEAVANAFTDRNDDISFGEFLLAELND